MAGIASWEHRTGTILQNDLDFVDAGSVWYATYHTRKTGNDLWLQGRTGLSFSAWVIPGAPAVRGALFEASVDSGWHNNYMAASYEGDGKVVFWYYCSDTECVSSANQQGYFTFDLPSVPDFDNTKWHHLAFTWDGTAIADEDRVKCYLNGVDMDAYKTWTVQQGSLVPTALWYQDAGVLVHPFSSYAASLPPWYTNDHNFAYVGKWGQFRFWGRTLTQDDIDYLYQSGAGRPETAIAPYSADMVYELLVPPGTTQTLLVNTATDPNGDDVGSASIGGVWTIGTTILEGSTIDWVALADDEDDLGSVDPGTPSDDERLRVKLIDGVGHRAGFYLKPSSLSPADLETLLDWGDSGYGVQLAQKTGPGDGDWSSWDSFSRESGGTKATRKIVRASALTPPVYPGGTIPQEEWAEFKVRVSPPAGASSGRKRFELGLWYE